MPVAFIMHRQHLTLSSSASLPCHARPGSAFVVGLLVAAPGVAFIAMLFLPQLDPGFSAKQLQVGTQGCKGACGCVWDVAWGERQPAAHSS